VFISAAAVVLWGTVLPLASEAVTGEQIAVGPPFFNRVLAPIGALLLLLSAFGTVVPWRRGSLVRVASRLAWPAAIATAVAAAILVTSQRGSFAGLVWIAMLLATTSVLEIARAARARSKLAGLSISGATRDLFARNPRRFGGYVVHLGVAIMVIGFAGSLGRTQTEIVARPGDSFAFAGYTFTYERLERSAPADKDVNLAVLELSRGDRRVATLRPQLNFHRNWDQPQSEIAIRTTPTSDLYVILAGIDESADGTSDDEAIFRIHHNPLVVWVWAGAIVALLGGLIALLVRTRRDVSAPAPAPGQLQRA
jgi:cytochrome c-type biogenesis protein CcmF